MPSPKRGRPRSEDIDEAVLRAAASLFEENGYKDTSLEAIALKAGVGRPTLYRRWANKAALATHVYEHLAPPPVFAPGTTVQQTLAALTRHVFAAYRDGPAATLLAGLIVEAQADGEHMAAFRDHFFTPRRQISLRLFQEAVSAQNEPALKDPELLADAYIGAIWVRVLTQSNGLTDADADALAALFTEILT